MKETRAQFRARLEAEGRWGAAVARREDLKAGGMGAKEAWDTIYQDFATTTAPPLASTTSVSLPTSDGSLKESSPPAPSPASPSGPPLPRVKKRKGKVDFKEEITWVYENMHTDNPGPAPSGGAAVMWQQARMDPRTFLRDVFQRMVPLRNQQAEEEDQKVKVQDRKFIDLARQCLEDYRRANPVTGATPALGSALPSGLQVST
jgi:hypothetical protein